MSPVCGIFSLVLCVALILCPEVEQGLSLMVEVFVCLFETSWWQVGLITANVWVWRLEDVESGRWAVDGGRWAVEVEVIEGERCRRWHCLECLSELIFVIISILPG